MKKLLIAALLSISFASSSAFAEDHVIKAQGMVFDPMFVFVEPGDTVTWTNMPAHLVESIKPMMPEGATEFLSEMGQTFSYTVPDTEGVIMYKCTPHWGARMGGAIVIGKPADAEKILAEYTDVAKIVGELKPAKGLIKKLGKEMQKQGIL